MATRLDCALLAAVLFAGGCASSGPYWSREDRGAAERVEMQERIASLEARLAAASGRNAVLQSEVDGLKRELESFRTQATPTSLPPPEVFETPPSTPVTRDRPQIDESDLEEPTRAEDSPTAAGNGAQELYDRSLDFLQQQRLADAEEGFARFLAANPDSDLADNAQFWLAECALRRGDAAAALAGFRAVVERYPEANKVPDALLKVGFCLASLGDAESAATVYRELLARYPETTAAETARQRLGAP